LAAAAWLNGLQHTRPPPLFHHPNHACDAPGSVRLRFGTAPGDRVRDDDLRGGGGVGSLRVELQALSGAVSGAIARCMVAPLDVVKIR
jgi:hypothetical protein